VDIRIDATDVQKLQERLNSDADLYRRGLRLQMASALTILKAAIQQNIRVRSGLHVRSGMLLNSIMGEVVEKGNLISGEIGPRDVPYAAVHEFGHDFPARRIEPRNAKVLAWQGASGQMWFSKGHDMPAFRVPARPYLRPALEQTQEIIAQKFQLFLNTSFGGK